MNFSHSSIVATKPSAHKTFAATPAVLGHRAAGAPITMRETPMKLESIALHHGYTPEATTKAAAVPIYQTTSYVFDNTQHGADLFNLAVPGNIYTRIMNPTQAVLEARV